MLIKEPGCQTRSRLIEKLAKVQKTLVHHTIWQHQKKIKYIDTYAYENGMSNVLLKGYSGG